MDYYQTWAILAIGAWIPLALCGLLLDEAYCQHDKWTFGKWLFVASGPAMFLAWPLVWGIWLLRHITVGWH